MSTAVELSQCVAPDARRLHSYDELVAEQHGIKESWILDPEAETVDVLALVRGSYELVMRSGPDETASSRLLAGFGIAVNPLFRG